MKANITGKVKYLYLNTPVADWVDCILGTLDYDRTKESDENIQLITENGFSIYRETLIKCHFDQNSTQKITRIRHVHFFKPIKSVFPQECKPSDGFLFERIEVKL